MTEPQQVICTYQWWVPTDVTTGSLHERALRTITMHVRGSEHVHQTYTLRKRVGFLAS